MIFMNLLLLSVCKSDVQDKCPLLLGAPPISVLCWLVNTGAMCVSLLC